MTKTAGFKKREVKEDGELVLPATISRPCDYEWVDSTEKLSGLAEHLLEAEAIGFDLEADSMFHFQEKICLIQMATPTRLFLVDPLCLEDLSPLKSVFASGTITKVLHGSDYDIRSLDRDYGIRIHGLFDTQIAARFLGIAATSLADLLMKEFGVRAEKKYQKKDWSVRPLPEDMLAYAAGDAAYLIPLFELLKAELSRAGRLSWVEEECELLSRVHYTPHDDAPLFKRLRGAGNLDSRGLAVAEEVLNLRHVIAKNRDRPPFKVLGNKTILEIARSRPATMEELISIDGFSKGQARSLGAEILRSVQRAMSVPQESLPVYPRKRTRRFSSGVMKKIGALKAWREKQAQDLGVDPSVVFTNAQIHAVSAARATSLRELERIEEVRNWQREAFGREVCRIMSRQK